MSPVSIVELNISFGKREILKGISLEISSGEVIGIIGKNGSGKSTLLKAIAGIIPPSSGSVNTIGHIAPMIELGAGFRSDLNSIENTILYGRLLGIKLDVLRSNANSIIEWAGLSERKTDPLSTFSSGMLARLAFSISSFGNPDILLIDEILSVGDRDFQKKSRERISFLMNSGSTVLLVSHDLATIEATCSKTLWIDEGEIRRFGNSAQVLYQYSSD